MTNPGYLVGPEDFERSVMGRFCVRYWRGMLPFSPPGGVNLVDVRDVARGHLLAAERGRPGRRYILGGENRTFIEFMAALAEVVGFRPGPRRSSPTGASPPSPVAVRPVMVSRRHPYPALQHARLNRYHWFYRSDRACAELGYTSRPLGESLADTFRWYSSRKTLKPRGPGRWWMRPEPRPGRAA